MFGRLAKKLALLAGRKRFRSELDEEMTFHRAQMEVELRAGGMDAETARHAAARQFGNVTLIKERSQEQVGFRLETVAQDLRFGLRQLRRSPGFALTAILILALGMGISVAIFGFVDAALIEPLPYAQPNRLMAVDETAALWPLSNLSRDDYQDWKRLNRSFQSIAAYDGAAYLLRTGGGTVPVDGARVSDDFFRTLGVKPILGRYFLPGEDQPGRPKIAILTYGTWRDRFGGRQNAIGESLTLSGDTYTIVGVLPRTFSFAAEDRAQFWVPLLDKTSCEQRRSCHDLYGVGRLRDGVTMQAANADLKAIAAQLERQYPLSNRGQGAVVEPLSELFIGSVRPILLTLLVGSALLLLIACVNVASLLLVRSESRRRETAVRAALGATPARLTRQFLTEGLLLAAAGCGAGLGVAECVMVLLKRLVPKSMAEGLPFLEGVGMNAHTALFAAAVAFAAALLLALTPVLRLAFQDIRDGLNEAGRGAAGRLWTRLGANLAVVELAIAVVLLVGAGLLGKSLYRLLRVDTGFDPTHLATVEVDAPENLYTKDPQMVALYREIERRISVLPGVQSVGITQQMPVQCNCDTDWIRIVGKPYHGEHNEVNERPVSPSYLSTLKARLLRGRFFRPDEDGSKPAVMIINQALADKYFLGEDPLGKKIGDDTLKPSSIREIVGVVANVREGPLDAEIWPAEYEDLYQITDTEFTVVARTQQSENSILPAMVSTIHNIDPNLGVDNEISMTDRIESSQASLLHRFSTFLVGGFAAMALLLSVVGLYGVIAYAVSQRTHEIGVRIALGARRGAVYRLVMGQAGELAALGLGIGMVCAVAASLLMRKLLFGVEAWDAPTLAAAAVVLGTTAMAASFLPARRAANVDPANALRME